MKVNDFAILAGSVSISVPSGQHTCSNAPIAHGFRPTITGKQNILLPAQFHLSGGDP